MDEMGIHKIDRSGGFIIEAYNNIPFTLDSRGWHYELIKCCDDARFKVDYLGCAYIKDHYGDEIELNYCPYCGKKIKVKKVKDNE